LAKIDKVAAEVEVEIETAQRLVAELEQIALMLELVEEGRVEEVLRGYSN
jgi:hypothetical protein